VSIPSDTSWWKGIDSDVNCKKRPGNIGPITIFVVDTRIVAWFTEYDIDVVADLVTHREP